jgi:hypothetical protein
MIIAQGYSAILDAKFDRRSYREKAMNIAKRHRVPFEILYCHAPLEVLRERLKQRSRDISDATPELLQQQQDNFEPFSEEERLYLRE